MTRAPFNVLWLQAGSCGGCSLSALSAEGAGLFDTLERFGIRLLWHPSFSEESGAEALSVIEDAAEGRITVDALCVEGSVMTGPHGTGRAQMLSGTGKPLADWIRRIAARARHTVAVGSCAAFGGIPAAGVNPGGATGLQYLDETPGGALGSGSSGSGGLPVINIAGCAPHPGWIVETLIALRHGDIGVDDLDEVGRPRFYADHLAHHGCNRNEFYEFKASAESFREKGCLMEHLGCLATQAPGDCNSRVWNGGGSCTTGGYSCIACTRPGFEEPGHAFLSTAKLGGLPTALPTDMPKAWFVALAALSKSATPDRVRRNARADHVVVPPGQAKRTR